MSNSIAFVGHLGQDAELRRVGENTVLEFTVANNVGYGERKITNWFRCNLWGKQAQSLEPMLLKGKQVFVTGELTLRPWTTREGVERLSPDVRCNNVHLIRGGQGEGSGPGSDSQTQEPRAYSGSEPAPAPSHASKSPSSSQPASAAPAGEDELPF